jgi:hypothetical protein
LKQKTEALTSVFCFIKYRDYFILLHLPLLKGGVSSTFGRGLKRGAILRVSLSLHLHFALKAML